MRPSHVIAKSEATWQPRSQRLASDSPYSTRTCVLFDKINCSMVIVLLGYVRFELYSGRKMTEFFTITLIISLAAISPGPDFALVVKNSLQYGRKSGVFTALGVSSSLLVHATYCILGLGIIISKSLFWFGVIKYLGAAYLIFLGIKSLLAKRREMPKIKEAAIHSTLSASKSFVEGLLCNLLNPKAIMFILAFFTLIVKPAISWAEQFGFGVEIAAIHLLWFSWLAVMITHHRVKDTLNKLEFYIVKIMGLVLIAFGASIVY